MFNFFVGMAVGVLSTLVAFRKSYPFPTSLNELLLLKEKEKGEGEKKKEENDEVKDDKKSN